MALLANVRRLTGVRRPRLRGSSHRRCSSAQGDVALVYGSFGKFRESRLDAQIISECSPAECRSVSGDAFQFDELRRSSFLILSTSSWLGFPPLNLVEFSHNLLLAARTNPGCLSHLQHTVWGNGDERWLSTYMSVPRYLDRLLEECGSRRFYARGERGEPHTPTAPAGGCSVKEWAPAMWAAMAAAEGAAGTPGVAWDALWDESGSPHHQEIGNEWDLESLVERHGPLAAGPSSLSKPGASYDAMLRAAARRVEEAREAKRRILSERAAARSSRPLKATELMSKG